MSSQQYFQKLEQQLLQLEQAVTPIGQKMTPKARFDRHLFVSHRTRLNDYVAEVRKNLHQLQQEATLNHLPQVRFLAQRLVDQISALQREQATLALRHFDAATTEKNTLTPYQRLSEHREYERRLLQMIQDKEAQQRHKPPASCSLQRELAVLEGRLQRCRQATKKLEKQIGFNERVGGTG